MNSKLFTLFAISTIAHAAQDDILRFTNGDQLHGTYQGMGEGNAILWTRLDLTSQISLKSENVRHILLHGAMPATDESTHSYVTLQNGDQIPGVILSFDEKNTRIRSHVVGEINIPSENISAIHPHPFGGKLQYAGPFSSDGWEVYRPEDRDPRALAKKKAETEPSDEEKNEDKSKDKKEEPTWQHSGSAWYHVKGMHVLARKNCLGDSTLMRFRLAWRERLNVNIGLNADFALPPEPKKDEAEEGKKVGGAGRQPAMFFNGMPTNHSLSFGNALVLTVYQSYFSLTRCGYDENGQVINQRMLQTQSGVQLPESGEATIEVRCNRAKGLLMLFVNGQYAAQWEDIESLKPKSDRDEGEAIPPLGNGFAIQCNSAIRLSEVVISEWSGIKDSAYSLSHEKRDIILLNNGTDRYSGEITEIKDDVAFFKNAYCALEIPLTEISEIVFAKKQQADQKEPTEGTVTARFYPTGKISGLAQSSGPLAMKLHHPLAQQLDVKLNHAVSLEFSDENPFLEIMDHQQEIQLTPDK